MQVNPLIPIGAVIKVDKSKIETLLPSKVLDELPQMINGEIVDYKMTDGMGIGYVIMTESSLKIWVFSSELNEQTRREYRVEDTYRYNNRENSNLVIGRHKVGYEMNGNRNIQALANPINLINWFIFTLKDVF